MIKIFLGIFFISANAYAYVPTVESIFRHGGNAEITANTVAMNLKVTKLKESKDAPQKRTEDHYRIFLTRDSEDNTVKIAQTRYMNNSFSESSIEHKVYYPDFTVLSLKPGTEQVEKGIFFSLLKSIVLNDGAHLVSYLKTLGAPVKLNDELINREKIEYLVNYKRYLVITNRDRKKTEIINPLRPEDASEKSKVDKIMSEPMYVDTNQVKLTRDGGEMAWLVNVGIFEAVVSYEKRQIKSIKYKSGAGEFEIICHDYWLANGTHYLPKTINVKNFTGELYNVEISNLRHFNEKEQDMDKRLQRWDQILQGKVSSDLRPEFLL
jgi:hypothetical protein